MPELPEVHTTVEYLRKEILGERVRDFWSDTPSLLKKPRSRLGFQKELKDRQIQAVDRRGKYVLFHLSGQKTMAIHQKMTGHLLVGKWKEYQGRWLAKGALADKVNSYIRLIITLGSGRQLALSDARKFATVSLLPSIEIEKILRLGPDVMLVGRNEFIKILQSRSARLKSLLMNQAVIAGIGNIYSDELLWEAGIHPLRKAETLTPMDRIKIFEAMRRVISQGIRLGGTTLQDFRKPDGQPGGYYPKRNVYDRENQPCRRDRALIKRIVIGQRSSYFCPKHQK